MFSFVGSLGQFFGLGKEEEEPGGQPNVGKQQTSTTVAGDGVIETRDDESTTESVAMEESAPRGRSLHRHATDHSKRIPSKSALKKPGSPNRSKRNVSISPSRSVREYELTTEERKDKEETILLIDLNKAANGEAWWAEEYHDEKNRQKKVYKKHLLNGLAESGDAFVASDSSGISVNTERDGDVREDDDLLHNTITARGRPERERQQSSEEPRLVDGVGTSVRTNFPNTTQPRCTDLYSYCVFSFSSLSDATLFGTDDDAKPKAKPAGAPGSTPSLHPNVAGRNPVETVAEDASSSDDEKGEAADDLPTLSTRHLTEDEDAEAPMEEQAAVVESETKTLKDLLSDEEFNLIKNQILQGQKRRIGRHWFKNDNGVLKKQAISSKNGQVVEVKWKISLTRRMFESALVRERSNKSKWTNLLPGKSQYDSFRKYFGSIYDVNVSVECSNEKLIQVDQLLEDVAQRAIEGMFPSSTATSQTSAVAVHAENRLSVIETGQSNQQPTTIDYGGVTGNIFNHDIRVESGAEFHFHAAPPAENSSNNNNSSSSGGISAETFREAVGTMSGELKNLKDETAKLNKKMDVEFAKLNEKMDVAVENTGTILQSTAKKSKKAPPPSARAVQQKQTTSANSDFSHLRFNFAQAMESNVQSPDMISKAASPEESATTINEGPPSPFLTVSPLLKQPSQAKSPPSTRAARPNTRASAKKGKPKTAADASDLHASFQQMTVKKLKEEMKGRGAAPKEYNNTRKAGLVQWLVDDENKKSSVPHPVLTRATLADSPPMAARPPLDPNALREQLAGMTTPELRAQLNAYDHGLEPGVLQMLKNEQLVDEIMTMVMLEQRLI
jgi:hypothetical protein